MKSRLLILSVTFFFCSVRAQELGLRFGGINDNLGVAVDGVFNINQSRIHADFGVYRGGVGVDILWDLIYKPMPIESFNWYLGIGPSAYIGNPFALGIAGEVGLEYRLAQYPIVLSIDWRPTFWLIEATQIKGDSFGLNVRWDFGTKPKE